MGSKKKTTWKGPRKRRGSQRQRQVWRLLQFRRRRAVNPQVLEDAEGSSQHSSENGRLPKEEEVKMEDPRPVVGIEMETDNLEGFPFDMEIKEEQVLEVVGNDRGRGLKKEDQMADGRVSRDNGGRDDGVSSGRGSRRQNETGTRSFCLNKRKSNISAGKPSRRQSPSVCFVCITPVNVCETQPFTKVTRTDCFNLLTDMLELSKSQANYYLEKLKQPEDWIALCYKCHQTVREAATMREEISKLETAIKKNQKQIVEKMKSTKLKSSAKERAINRLSGKREQDTVIENILQYVDRRKYRMLCLGRPKNDQQPNVRRYKTAKTNENVCKSKSPDSVIEKLVASLPPYSPSASQPVDNETEIETPIAIDGEVTDVDFTDDPLSNDRDEPQDEFLCDQKSYPTERFLFTQQPTPPPTTSTVPIQFLIRLPPQPLPLPRLYYCGLCNDDKMYTSHEQLQLHTNVVHRAPLLLPKPAEPPVIPDQKLIKCRSTAVSSSEKKHENSILESGSKMTLNLSKATNRIKPEEPSRYSCPNCPDVINYCVTRYAQHLAIHQRKPYKCSVCSEFLPADTDLQEHHWIEKHSSVEIATTSSQTGKKFLKQVLDPGKIWKCEWCKSGFFTEDDRKTHEQVDCAMSIKGTQNFNYPYKCKTCKKRSRNMEEWRLHRVLNHIELDRLSCLCCDLSFAEKTVEGVEIRHVDKMVEHFKQKHLNEVSGPTTGRDFDECDSCGLVFVSTTETQSHFKKVHGISTGEKIFSCPVSCGKKFVNSLGLRKHVREIHYSEEPLVCDICGSSFKRPTSLLEHKLQKHDIISEGSKVRTCPAEGCDFKAVKFQTMTLHSQNVHGGARKYNCKYCKKGFTSSSKRKHHEQIHENKETKPFVCDICGNNFALYNYLYIHKRLSHEGRTFPSTNRKRAPTKPRNKVHSRVTQM